jgi:hypothetical protein
MYNEPERETGGGGSGAAIELGRVVWSEIMSQWHRASCDANTHHDIPNERERPEQGADHEQPNRAIREPRLVTPQMNVRGIKRRDARSAERDESNEELSARNSERREKARDEDDRNPTFGGKCECAFHGGGSE